MTNEIDDLEIKLLLYDHKELSEESRYRDSLILNGFYFSLAVFAAFIVAIITLNPIQHCIASSIISFISSIIFLTFSISLESIRGARDAANKRRKDIENDPRLKDLVKTRNSIDGRTKNMIEKITVGKWIGRLELLFFILWIIAGIVILLMGFKILKFN